VFQTAVRAGVPIEVKSKSPDASGLPANSMDAVVSVYAMSELSDSQVASSLSEAVRVLKPGKPFIFVENVGAKATVLRAAQGALETIGRMMGNKTCATRDLLPFLEVCCAFTTHLQISWLRNTQKLNHFWQPV
jgi:ubiquinone/menaquinone biosynthesis C-methylase UbiE